MLDFVEAGGGYIGTGGGAFLGLQHLRFYGHGPKQKGYPPACHAHGCNTSVEFVAAGRENLGLKYKTEFDGNVTIMYHNGPMLKQEDLPSNVTVLAFFREQGTPLKSALQAEYTPYNITNNTPAITSTEFGAGRVVLNSPHPEHLPGLAISAEIYAGELSWVLPRDHLVRIGFYTGKGIDDSIGDLYRMIGESAGQSFGPDGYMVANLSSGAAVSELTRDNYDLVIFPGGSGTGLSNELGV